MGWVMGFEPTNGGTTIRCLNHLATPTKYGHRSAFFFILSSPHQRVPYYHIYPTIWTIRICGRLYPFCTASTITLNMTLWSGWRDLNPRPSEWQSDALPTEPQPHLWWTYKPAASYTAHSLFYRECRTIYRLWSGLTDSNRRPNACKALALTSCAKPGFFPWAGREYILYALCTNAYIP